MRAPLALTTLALAALLPDASGQSTPRQAQYTNNACTPVRAVVEDGHALASDGKGPYVEAQDEARVQARGGMSIWSWRFSDGLTNKPEPNASGPKVRALRFDLDHPVEGGGGQRLGVITDPIGRLHAMWKHEGNTLRAFTTTPVGKTVVSDRIEMWVYVKGHQYVLQMGPWSMGLFSPRAAVSGEGTSRATIRRDSETEWVISAPKGSIARLSKYDDHKAPKDIGLYYFDFSISVSTIKNAQCQDIR